MKTLAAAVAVAFATMAGPSLAEGNLAANGTDLTLEINTIDLKFSQEVWELETGKYYQLDVTSDGNEEIAGVVGQLPLDGDASDLLRQALQKLAVA